MPKSTKARTVGVRISRKILEHSYVEIELKEGQTDEEAIEQARDIEIYDLEFDRVRTLSVDYELT